jgi:hypothetical protein
MLGLLLVGCAEKEDCEITGPGLPDLEYVGTDQCATCHPSIYDDFIDSGHNYKLNKVVGAQAPTYPHSSVPNPPGALTWSDITYVIGGYGWKARFLDSDGFIILGDGVQYNLPRSSIGIDGGWVRYTRDDAHYTCGSCHTTGWQAGVGHQDGLEGISGTWFATGIQCEACHGPGSRHVVSQSADDIVVDTDAIACGDCHFRDEYHLIAASSGFIKHHEQYDEMISAGHRGLKCIECHDPHISSLYAADEGGIVSECDDCHTTVTVDHRGPDDCVYCHMPRASKSAAAANKYSGDVRTHIFAINAESANKDDMFYNDGKLAHGFVTLDMVCYQCHDDDEGVGGGSSTILKEDLPGEAADIH